VRPHANPSRKGRHPLTTDAPTTDAPQIATETDRLTTPDAVCPVCYRHRESLPPHRRSRRVRRYRSREAFLRHVTGRHHANAAAALGIGRGG